MSIRRRIASLLLCLIGVALAGVLVSSQIRENQTATAPVISGSDIGFRPDSVQHNGRRISGTFVVRVNGQWVEAQFSARTAPTAP